MKCYKGSILSVNARDEVFSFLVEDRGRIVFVGNELPEIYAGVETVDLGKGALIPAFVDSHQHFASFAIFNSGLNVMDAESNGQISQMIADFYARSGKAKTLIAFGASPYSALNEP